MDPYAAELTRLAEANLLRRLRALEVTGPVAGRLDGRDVLLFSSNDYLGLSAHPHVRERAAAAAAEHGMGPRGSALLCGWTRLHEELAARLAAFFEAEACFLFPSGYLANLGVLQAIGRFGGTVLSGERNHASLIDGCRASRLEIRVFRDLGHLEELLASAPAPRTIASDTVFSMDGDLAPIADLARIAARHGAELLLDEAHAMLVHGPGGRGLGLAACGGEAPVIRVGTLSKAFGALGGFVLGSRSFVDCVVNLARTGLFSTALPLPVVAASLAALDVVEGDDTLRERLWSRVRVAGETIPSVARAASPILPVILGTEERALAAAASLLEAGLHVPAVRPPTVPPGTSRLRITLTASHDEADVRRLAAALHGVGA